MTAQWLTDDTTIEALAASVLRDRERWGVSEWPAPVDRVRRAAHDQRRQQLAVSASVVATLAVVVTSSALAFTTHHDEQHVRVSPPLGDGQSSSGLKWLLTPKQWADYSAAHPTPSPSIQHGPSPAPPDDNLRGLEADVQAAIPGVTFTREDAADSGEVGHAVVWGVHGDTPVVVERRSLHYPVEAGEYFGGATGTEPVELPTGSAEVTITDSGSTGYGTGLQSWSGPFVLVATADGWLTTWTAPTTPEQLKAWAVDADQHTAP